MEIHGPYVYAVRPPGDALDSSADLPSWVERPFSFCTGGDLSIPSLLQDLIVPNFGHHFLATLHIAAVLS